MHKPNPGEKQLNHSAFSIKDRFVTDRRTDTEPQRRLYRTVRVFVCIAYAELICTEYEGFRKLSESVILHQADSAFYSPWDGKMSTSQRAVMLCGWGVKAGMV